MIIFRDKLDKKEQKIRWKMKNTLSQDVEATYASRETGEPGTTPTTISILIPITSNNFYYLHHFSNSITNQPSNRRRTRVQGRKGLKDPGFSTYQP